MVHRTFSIDSVGLPIGLEVGAERDSVPTWRRRQVTLALFAAVPFAYAVPSTPVELWKGTHCNCCGDWVKHLESNGFTVKVREADLTKMRGVLRMPDELASCHTALIEGYAFEGHVPVREIRRLLHERPKAIGLAVPGMRLGTRGMDGPQYGGRKQSYDVLLV